MNIIIQFFRNLFFILFFILFMIKDIRYKEVTKSLFIIFGIVGILFIVLEYDSISPDYIINTIYSIGFGFLILLFSLISRESIGVGDSLFFIIAGLYLSLSDNVMLFLSGLFIASVYGGYKYLRYKSLKIMGDTSIPFIPCLLPMMVWRIMCLV